MQSKMRVLINHPALDLPAEGRMVGRTEETAIVILAGTNEIAHVPMEMVEVIGPRLEIVK